MSPPSALLLLLSQIVPETQARERESISAVPCHQHVTDVSGFAISLLLILIVQQGLEGIVWPQIVLMEETVSADFYMAALSIYCHIALIVESFIA